MSVISHWRTGICAITLALPVGLAAEPIEQVVVTATRSESPLRNLPLGITVLTAEQIRQGGARHLVEALRSQGGVEISDLFGDGSDAAVGLRGFAATAGQNTLIMIDGRRLNNADNSLPDLNTMAIDAVDRIEIVNGSLGTLYGDKAVGGVINIITRRPEATRLEVRADLGSYNQRALTAGVEHAHANGVSYRAGVTRRLSDNYRDNNGLQLSDAYAMLRFTHAGGELFAELQGQDENLGAPGALFRDQVDADRLQALNPDDFVNTDTRSGRAGLRQQLGEALELQAEYTNRFSETAGQLSSGGVPSRFDSKRHHVEFTPRLILALPLAAGDSAWTLGADLFETDYLIRSDFGVTDDTQAQQSIYLRGVIPISARINGIAGVRYGEVNNDILVDTLAFGRSLPEGTEIDDEQRAWELGLSYQLTAEWQLFGRIDRNYRFVTADEYSAVADNNYFADLFAFGTVVPLPATQRGRSVEAGVNWDGNDASLRLQLYQLDLIDEIVFDPLLFLNTNAGDTRRRGLTLEAQKSLTPAWTLAATYNYVDAEFVSGSYEGAELSFVPAHSGSVRSHWQMNEQFSAYFELAGVSERVLGGDFTNTFEPLAGHLVGNLNLSWQRDVFELALRVNNLFGHEYSDAANTGFDFRNGFVLRETYYPAPGRNVMLSVQYRYE